MSWMKTSDEHPQATRLTRPWQDVPALSLHAAKRSRPASSNLSRFKKAPLRPANPFSSFGASLVCSFRTFLSSSRPWSGPLPLLLFFMAPITDSTVSDLKDLVHKLEARVHQLEERLGDGGKKPKSLSDSMRMILIGPPGAGEPRSFKNTDSTNADTVFCREGHSSTANQEQVLRLSFGQHPSKNPEK
jgi:hypothetical protein